MQQWFKDHMTFAAALVSLSAYAFTNFARVTYVNEIRDAIQTQIREREATRDHQLDQIATDVREIRNLLVSRHK